MRAATAGKIKHHKSEINPMQSPRVNQDTKPIHQSHWSLYTVCACVYIHIYETRLTAQIALNSHDTVYLQTCITFSHLIAAYLRQQVLNISAKSTKVISIFFIMLIKQVYMDRFTTLPFEKHYLHACFYRAFKLLNFPLIKHTRSE